ncbi:SGNH/GDSL hydrolase family protein [Cerasicoccus fimbriatus]|uniref:SGNH/GDSL hydrolase family protein n=1 Tax=Cerasicoccus fimbriatus TaxID=3014554 RepID=UPI0022B54F2F|nr:SGNH/GDSL hydrolase family protein [Cerasicoccus sp. TK19100]
MSYCFILKIRRFLLLASVLVPTLSTMADVQPMRVVGTNSRMSPFTYSPGATNTAFWQRTPHKLGGPVAEIDIAFMNWAVGYSGEVINSSDVTISYAWLERDSDGQIVPLTFDGEREVVLLGGVAEPYYMADPVDSSVWTGGTPQRDEVFWLHVKGSVPATDGKACLGVYATYSGSKFLFYDPANDPGTVDTAGAVPNITGKNQRTNGLAVMFGGRFTGPGYLSVIGLGDSILHGSGDATNPTPVISGSGFLDRAALDSDGENAVGMLSLARHGESANTFVNSHAMREVFLPFANVVVEEYGTNDIGSNGTGDADVIYTRLQAIWQLARDAGVEKVLRTKLMPRTTSASGNWTSLADQTPNNGWGEGGERDQLNAHLETALSQGLIDVLVDTLTPVADPTDDHYWVTTGANDYATKDGTHPNGQGYALAAVPLRAAFEAILAANETLSYLDWSDAIDWGAEDSSPEADPNHDGVSNWFAYALDLPPLDNLAGKTATFSTDSDTADGPWLTFDFRTNQLATGIQYSVLRSEDLLPSSWTALSPDGVNVIEETLQADPDGDGSAALKRWRVKVSGATPCFLKLQADET